MICIIALVTFGVLSIFSAKYRPWAKEAFRCVLRRATLRPCDTRFDKKMKSKITGKLLKKSPRLAGFVYKHFELISWIFTIILILSIYYSILGLYNLYQYGTCDPVTGFCPFGKKAEGVCPENLSSPGMLFIDSFGMINYGYQPYS